MGFNTGQLTHTNASSASTYYHCLRSSAVHLIHSINPNDGRGTITTTTPYLSTIASSSSSSSETERNRNALTIYFKKSCFSKLWQCGVVSKSTNTQPANPKSCQTHTEFLMWTYSFLSLLLDWSKNHCKRVSPYLLVSVIWPVYTATWLAANEPKVPSAIVNTVLL